jgi:hypothetical protein
MELIHLIRDIKERHMVFLLNHIGKSLPLLWSWVYSSWIVSTTM